MSIRVKTLDEAVAEAKRFLAAADRVKRMAGWSAPDGGEAWYGYGQYTAAAKRASMDLTRALAGLRRGGG